MKSIKDLEAIRQRTLDDINLRNDHRSIRVVEIKRRGVQDAMVTQTGCIGVCRLEPMVEVYMPGQEKVTYVLMTPEKVARVVGEHLINGKPVTEYTIGAVE